MKVRKNGYVFQLAINIASSLSVRKKKVYYYEGLNEENKSLRIFWCLALAPSPSRRFGQPLKSKGDFIFWPSEVRTYLVLTSPRRLRYYRPVLIGAKALLRFSYRKGKHMALLKNMLTKAYKWTFSRGEQAIAR